MRSTMMGMGVALLSACATTTPAATPMLVGEVIEPDEVSGYGDAVFVADPRRGRVLLRAGGTEEVLATGLNRPWALLQVGGRLWVGTGTDVVRIDLKTKQVDVVARDVGPVLSLERDHVGHVVAATTRAEAPVIRITSAKEVKRLEVGRVVSGSVRFNPVTVQLRAKRSNGKPVTFDYFALVGDDRAQWEKRGRRPMHPFTRHGITLTGAEYWPNRGTQKTRYPDDVLWGFYPEKGVVFEGEPAPAPATKAAVQCAQTAYEALARFIDNHHEALHAASQAPQTSRRFYLWVNDYSEAAPKFPHPLRPARLWYWQRTPPVPGRVVGYWKWETTLTPEGTCQVPAPPAALKTLQTHTPK